MISMHSGLRHKAIQKATSWIDPFVADFGENHRRISRPSNFTVVYSENALKSLNHLGEVCMENIGKPQQVWPRMFL